MFKDGGATLGSGTVNSLTGKATFSTAALSIGGSPHSITAQYGGDGNNAVSASAALTQTVSQASTTTTVVSDANPASFGQTVTFTATVGPVAPGAGTPGGSVQFVDGSTDIGAPQALSGGTASLSTSALSTGSHQITAVYQGSANFAGSTSAVLPQTVVAATSTTITNSAALATPSNAGDPVTVQFSVSAAPGAGTPTGSVTVTFDSGGSCMASVADGQCAATPVGAATTVHVSATYTPDTGDFAGSTSSSVDHPIN
jgi:hypothetical protein